MICDVCKEDVCNMEKHMEEHSPDDEGNEGAVY